MTPAEYWRSNKTLLHTTPPGELFPEVGLYDKLTAACKGSVFEFGCGYGRLAPAFHPSAYIGYDINPTALAAARKNAPAHLFTDMEWPDADTVLAHTVLLHIPDDQIQETLDRMKAYKRIVIGEITGRHWRRRGDPPVFNREIGDYERMLGISCTVIKVPYPRYSSHLSLMVFDT